MAEKKPLVLYGGNIKELQTGDTLGGAPGEKITELAALTAPIASDIVAVVDDPVGTPETKKATLLDVVKGVLDVKHAKLGTDVNITADNTWADGPSLSLSAGSWLVMALVTLQKTATTEVIWQARLTNAAASTHYAETGANSASVANQGVALTMVTLIVLESTTTVKIQATTSSGRSTTTNIKAQLAANGSANTATQITAIRVA